MRLWKIKHRFITAIYLIKRSRLVFNLCIFITCGRTAGYFKGNTVLLRYCAKRKNKKQNKKTLIQLKQWYFYLTRENVKYILIKLVGCSNFQMKFAGLFSTVILCNLYETCTKSFLLKSFACSAKTYAFLS